MNFFNCRRLVALMLSCGAVMIVIVNGQATTDDDIGTDENCFYEIAKVKDNLATAVDEIAKLKDHVASLTANKPDDSKFNFLIIGLTEYHRQQCVPVCVLMKYLERNNF